MARKKIVILGGSSPFTAGLVDALVAAAPPVPACRLWLHGRDEENLRRVARHARARLEGAGWSVDETRSLDGALEGADIVLHQVRYGDLAGRARDEALAARFGAPADETLGAAAIAAALRMAPPLEALAAAVRRLAPGAWFVNLTNPLTHAVEVLHRAGVPRVVGLCELPIVTLREACQALAVPLDRLEWDYCGLNHRGFLHRLSVEGQDLLPRVAAAADQRPIGGVRGATIRELAALPLKYFRFYSGEAGGGGGRAEALRDLRRRLSAELDGAPGGPAPALGERHMDWYPHAVVPFLSAVLTDSGAILTVNAYDEAAGLVAERRVRVRADRIEALGTAPPPPAVAAWLDRAMAQERAAARAVATREVTWIRRALDLDPLVPPSAAAELSLALAASAARPSPERALLRGDEP